MLIGILLLTLWLFAIPILIGGIGVSEPARRGNLIFRWVCGQILLWAIFQLLCVPHVLREEPLSLVIARYGMVVLLLASAVLVLEGVKYFRQKKALKVVAGKESMSQNGNRKVYYLLWVVFWGLLVFQLLMSVVMTYGDGDDAYYIATAAIAEESNGMYLKLPYTGGTTGVEKRYGLAPFPMWIAFLARISGIRSVTMAHVVLPGVLIAMTYAIYYLMGKKLFGQRDRKNLPIFMIIMELLVLFGDYSHHSPQNFMIARSRQGKAALGNIILPMLVFLLLLILMRMNENRKIEVSLWIMLTAAITAGCLCSTFAALLVSMLVGITGLCAAVCYRRWKFLFPMGLCCLPAVCFAGMYLIY